MITLSHTSTTVTLKRFRQTAELPRSQVLQSRAAVGYSYHGNAYPTGPRRTPERWQFTALVTLPEWQALQLIDAKSQRAARTAPYTGFEIQVIDGTQQVTEATQTKAASGLPLVNNDGSVTYIPMWSAMFESLKLEVVGRSLWAVCSLAEGSRLAA